MMEVQTSIQVGNGDREKWMIWNYAVEVDLKFNFLDWGVAKEREDSRITSKF